MARQRNQSSGFSGIIAIMMIVAIFMFFYFMISSISTILASISSVLIVLTAIINYKVILNYITWIIDLFKKKPLLGIGAGLGTVVFSQFVAAYLFFKAVVGWRLKKAIKAKTEDYTDYEVVEEETVEDDFLELPEIEKVQQRQSSSSSKNEYEDLF